MSELIVPVSNNVALDDNSYVVAPPYGSWSDNYQALQDSNRALDDGNPYVSLQRERFKASFRIGTPAAAGPFDSITQVASVKINTSVIGEAHVALLVRDSITGERSLGRWWSVPADTLWHDLTQVWTVNPISKLAWDSSSVGASRWRFGIARLPQYDGVLVSRLYVEVP